MKLTIEVDFEDAMANSLDPPQNIWSETDFEEDFKNNLWAAVNDLEATTGAQIVVKDENGKDIF